MVDFSIKKLQNIIAGGNWNLSRSEFNDLIMLLPSSEYTIYRNFNGDEKYIVLRAYNIIMEII